MNKYLKVWGKSGLFFGGIMGVFYVFQHQNIMAGLAGGGGEMMSIFLPTTPNPTSGFLLFLPKEDVIELDMSVEEAAKLVISAGLVYPQENGVGEEVSDQSVAAGQG